MGIVDAREHVDMRGDDAGAPAGQRDRHLHRRTPPPAALANQEIAQHAVDQDTAEIVDPAIALGLGDQRDDVVGAEPFLGHCRLDAGGVLDVLHRDLADDYRHGFPLSRSYETSLREASRAERRRSPQNPKPSPSLDA